MQDRQTIRSQLIVLVVMFTAFAPLTISWYLTLDSLDCKNTDLGVGHVTAEPLGQANRLQHSCYNHMEWQWAALYIMNGFVFGIPLLAIFRTVNKNHKLNEELR